MDNKRKPIIAGNWKMHGSKQEVRELLNGIKQKISAPLHAEIVVFPPFVYLEEVENLLQNTPIQWGGQNLATELKGAFTGEISGPMLMDFGCRFVLVGHSERRHLFGEDNATVAKKFALAKAVGLIPILCVGETLEQRKSGKTQEIIGEQINSLLGANGGVQALENAIIAYEPVWAIGTGVTATPDQAQEIHAGLRQLIAQKDSNIADRMRILYGGSLKASNAKELFAMPDIDGGLIGGASLNVDEFIDIYRFVK